MRTPVTLATTLAAAAATAAAAPPSDITPEQAGARFAKNCIGCHQPPDPSFATDRAWIAQLRETA